MLKRGSETVCSWTSVEHKIEIYRTWDAWFDDVAEHAERNCSRRKQSADGGEVHRSCKHRCGLVKPNYIHQALERRYASD